jgi:hypothetical protein
MIAPNAGRSVNPQCMLLGIARSSFYYQPRPPSAASGAILRWTRESGQVAKRDSRP